MKAIEKIVVAEELFLNGVIVSEISNYNKGCGYIGKETDLEWDFVENEKGLRVNFTWIIGCKIIDRGGSPVCDDHEYITEDDYIIVLNGQEYSELEAELNQIFERVNKTQYKGY